MIPGNMTKAQYRKLYAKNAMELQGISVRTQNDKVFAEDIISKGMLIEVTREQLRNHSRIGFWNETIPKKERFQTRFRSCKKELLRHPR